MSCETQILTTTDQLQALRGEWEQLLALTDCTIYQTFEWNTTWWEYYGAGRELRCFLFRQGGALIGIAPFFVERTRMPLVRDLRQMKLLGCPEAEYQHIIAKSGCEEAILESLCGYLATHRDEWDVLDIESMSEESCLLPIFKEQLRNHSLPEYLYQGSVSAHVHLPASFEEYLCGLDKVRRHEYRRKWNGLTNTFDARIERFTRPDETLHAALLSFFEIHDARWESLGYPREFDDEHVRNFVITLAQRFAQREWLDLTFLTVNGSRVAMSLNFCYRSTVYAVHSQAAGPEEIMRYSPGLLVKMKGIEQAIGDRRTLYDLLRGEYAYKYRDFGASPSRNWMVRTVSSRRRLKIRLAIFLGFELLKKMRCRLQQEYWELRRYRVTHGNSFGALLGFSAKRVSTLARTGIAYAKRYAGISRKRSDSPPDDRTADTNGEYASLGDFRVGEVVEVRPESEVLSTLDPGYDLDGIPFMPEMLRYCGRRFRVSGWAHKTCVEGYGLRALSDVVFLEDLRCDGASHDGCQRACLLFWKTRWLRKANGRRGKPPRRAAGGSPEKRPEYVTKQGDRYVCQSTELCRATRPLPWWNLKQYVNDFRSGRLELAGLAKGVVLLGVGKARKILFGYRRAGLQGTNLKTPQASIGLRPEEQVRTRTQEEIKLTLDREGKNRGLEFSPEMSAFCDRTLTVQSRVSKIILEQTGEMKALNDTVILKGAVCDGVLRRWCPRRSLLLWREIWLERPDASGPPRPPAPETK